MIQIKYIKVEYQIKQNYTRFQIQNFKNVPVIYLKFNKSIVCRTFNLNNNSNVNNDIKYCFPDLAVYFQKISKIECLEDINNFINIPDLIIYNNKYILIGETLSKLYCMIETMDKYIDLCDDYENLISIDNNFIQNMEQEKYRKKNQFNKLYYYNSIII